MKLIASMVVHNEADRYLYPVIDHLLEFCDEIRVLDDGSTDGTPEYLAHDNRIAVMVKEESTFYEHEGNTRQQLLEWTMQGQPTHILAIDADEIVVDGQALRWAMELGNFLGVWKLRMTEVWGATEQGLLIRWDGKWKPRPCPIAFEVPPDHWENRQYRRHYRMPPSALACGRTPILITQRGNRLIDEPITDILHLGWACKADRAQRYSRYEVHDGGAHHDIKHLTSIMFPDEQVDMRPMAWPHTVDRGPLLDRINRG